MVTDDWQPTLTPLITIRGRPLYPPALLPLQAIGCRNRVAPQLDAGATCGGEGDEYQGSGATFAR